MTYRPTVRYADIFRDYVDSLFHTTTLDRNQIIRGALFSAALSEEFQELLKPYKKKDTPLPSPLWCPDQHEIWLTQCPEINGGSKDVNPNDERRGDVEKGIKAAERLEDVVKLKEGEYKHSKLIERQERLTYPQSKTFNKGGITIRIG